jgi:shikimate kinase
VARLVLVGMPGTGKSTLAVMVAARLGCEAVDTDEEIEKTVGCAASEYLRREGEPAFRKEELRALRDALRGDVVVSTGGGVVTSNEARELLGSQVTLWLDGDDDILIARLQGGDRPLLGEDMKTDLARLRAQREDWYREVSLRRVDAEGTLDEVVRRICDAAAVA